MKSFKGVTALYVTAENLLRKRLKKLKTPVPSPLQTVHFLAISTWAYNPVLVVS